MKKRNSRNNSRYWTKKKRAQKQGRCRKDADLLGPSTPQLTLGKPNYGFDL